MNVYDSQLVGGQLEKLGYENTKKIDKADLILLNTCSIREKAEEKVFSDLGRIKHMKRKNKTVWGDRFNSATSKVFEKIGASIDTDKRLFEEDIFGSIVHTQMLIKQKIIKTRNKDLFIRLKSFTE